MTQHNKTAATTRCSITEIYNRGKVVAYHMILNDLLLVLFNVPLISYVVPKKPAIQCKNAGLCKCFFISFCR